MPDYLFKQVMTKTALPRRPVEQTRVYHRFARNSRFPAQKQFARPFLAKPDRGNHLFA